MCEALKIKPESVFETEKKREKKNQLFCQTMQVQTAVSRIEREEEVKPGGLCRPGYEEGGGGGGKEGSATDTRV